ncbi:transcriptional regulator, AsnC family [Methanohalobium evestigatum Z-7303]|uniref:Transcriptional regulator, AsnC family n=1 Tax=Methanohalobium evestigatum (strain ATCC BAA-1072 / DSM 3721 / NBRC 107634 / OCM 161 / Z-7303) TaxID=644295 RepID=D7E6A2_METEZ|nr:Lrp/AsnC ligand binding domain-containing protein [Methanohalobium evestigatum]ADI73124.1 transcriptional regulator, AsnC family [Methanohalobium evestigatum Z-7303]
MDKHTWHILEILEENARATPEDIASQTGLPVTEVNDIISKLEKDKIIRKYKTIIDWEQAGEDYVYAIIELKVVLERKQGYQAIAERLYKFPEVRSVRLISGDHDISITVRGRSMKEVAFFVAEKIATLEQIHSTSTHFVLKTYKEDGFIFDEPEKIKRLPVSP